MTTKYKNGNAVYVSCIGTLVLIMGDCCATLAWWAEWQLESGCRWIYCGVWLHKELPNMFRYSDVSVIVHDVYCTHLQIFCRRVWKTNTCGYGTSIACKWQVTNTNPLQVTNTCGYIHCRLGGVSPHMSHTPEVFSWRYHSKEYICQKNILFKK